MRFETTIIGLLAAATTAVAVSVPPQARVAGGLIARQEEADEVDVTPTRVKRGAEDEDQDEAHFNPTRSVEHDDPNDPEHSDSVSNPPVKARDETAKDQVDESAAAESEDDASADQDSSDESLSKREDKDKSSSKDDKHTDGDSHDAASHKAGGKNMTNMPNMTTPAPGGAKGAASGVGVSVMLGTVLGGAALFMAL
ncbi:hypothetical protein PpBr36_00074 [Pyricularia pennisetigena]|uniref:hypothetical protein n=1 Tax=Pyricularia pennisetigena TaxID=1578925 RepID=UPI0011515A74|nr:hypothetical protein PpBr36_00074 [Pyricularia pennisetigena]TLS28082.1 hypothetical protein PpBr36_00074 [Pyricularia pennisetigena]